MGGERLGGEPFSDPAPEGPGWGPRRGSCFAPTARPSTPSTHAVAYRRLVSQVRPLPGARELLAYLTERGVPWTIATSGLIESAQPTLELLGVGPDVPVVTRD